MNCERDWFNVYGSRALDQFGSITQPRVLTADNAWRVQRDWRREGNDQYYAYNHLTEERRPLTQEQYDNDNITTEDGRLNIT